MTQPPLPPVAITDYAPSGTLRIAINHGNRVLADRGDAGRPIGISVDLARALAAELGTEPVFVEFDRAGDVSASAEADVWDVCFLAVDPDRARTISFTPPYIRIEGCYLAGRGSDAGSADEVISRKLTVGSVEGSAYALHLARRPGSEQLVTFGSMQEAVAAFDAGRVDALAGIRKAMEEIAAPRAGARVLQPPFMEILQAMGIPAGRPAAHRHLCAFLDQMVRAGETRWILEKHGVDGGAAILPT
ncbi:transporter substrate-binding domain-containing protein [Paracoccus sp. DMF-8]|uniref:transporter substrate-binding domain-containing protein n=1 Tax=Paracoccus sp. DMF-8 TaxID=3019445 RepID=UPI0023E8A010|nr:transporter substrate-binding domain-containing protein [Paracoccus sp. DMF-8]MDF3606687.1 transporter substrate-binding domain-containing protein [Paracoccus sp. DMF-8]